jgi:membrane-associated protease RseP (regulator of RpoE activity)
MAYPDSPTTTSHPDEEPYILAEVAPTDVAEVKRTHHLPLLAIVLYATCFITTFSLGGPIYAAAVMGILSCHEAGHYIQARRYRVPASVPYFIPVPYPYSLIGTMGAVIAMRGHMGNRKALFDIGISGPLAGLVPTLICTIGGLWCSQIQQIPAGAHGVEFSEPLLFRWLIEWRFGPIPADSTVIAHPLALAGWVGVLLTAVNLFPAGQLDGGHILYAILRKKAHVVAWLVILGAAAGMVLTQQFMLMPMLILVMVFRPEHPPTADDDVPLGIGRMILGWLTLAFVFVGLTPTPFVFR